MTDMWTDELTEPAGDEQTWARPRASITVAAQPHYSRFVDMADLSWAPRVANGQEVAA
ncbi:hypothetical protein KBZ21_40285 [Streptomyces sp. A73]|nr:hypothetical protein [Streptomyces sp. A73]